MSAQLTAHAKVLRILACLFLLLLLTPITMSPQPTTAGPIAAQGGPTGEMAYTQENDGAIIIQNFATGRTKRLVDDGRDKFDLVWSRNGRYLAYQRDEPEGDFASTIWVLNLATEQATKLMDVALYGNIAISNDGQVVAFTQGFSVIYTIRADGSGLTRITDESGENSLPIFAPDGGLYFVRISEIGETNTHLLIKRSPSGNESQIYDMELPTSMCSVSDLSLFEDRFLAVTHACASRGRAVQSIDLKTREVSNIRDAMSSYDCHYDGQWAHHRPLLAFVDSSYCADLDLEDSDKHNTQRLGVATFEGVAPQGIFIFSEANVGSPQWSPDDRWLAFSTHDDNSDMGASLLWVINSQGGDPQRIAASVKSYDWRPIVVLPPTPTATPIPPIFTPVPPTATPTPGVNPAEAKRWIDEKRSLIPDLEATDISTSLFTVPGVALYDETAARALIEKLDTKLQQGTLTPEQLEAFARLTIQERALAKTISDYADVAAIVSDTAADAAETGLGMLYVLRPLWKVCKLPFGLCDKLQRSADATVWKLIRHAGEAFSRWSNASSEDGAIGAKIWDITVRVAEDKLAKGTSLLELVASHFVQFAGTTLLVQDFRDRTQTLMDKGVRTANLDITEGDRWKITGDRQDAIQLTEGISSSTNELRETSIEFHMEYEKTVATIKLVEDIASLATLSPLAAFAKGSEIGIRAAHIVGDGLYIYQNAKKLQCIRTLTRSSLILAFDVAQPEVLECASSTWLAPLNAIGLAAPQQAPPLSLLHVRIQDDTSKYQHAVEQLLTAVQSEDYKAIEAALQQVLQAEAALGRSLEQAQVVVLEKEPGSANSGKVLQETNDFTMGNFALYLSVAETLMAREQKTQPESDVQQVAQTAISNANASQQASRQVDLSPPQSKPVLLIQQLTSEITSDRQLRLNIDLKNVGAGEAKDVRLILSVNGTQVGTPVQVGLVAANGWSQQELLVPMPSTNLVTVEAWSGDVLMDSRIEPVPAVEVVADATPGETGMLPTVTPGVLPTPLRESGTSESTWLFIIAIGGVAGLAGIVVGLLLARRKKQI